MKLFHWTNVPRYTYSNRLIRLKEIHLPGLLGNKSSAMIGCLVKVKSLGDVRGKEPNTYLLPWEPGIVPSASRSVVSHSVTPWTVGQ